MRSFFRLLLLGGLGWSIYVTYWNEEQTPDFSYLQIKSHYEKWFGKVTAGNRIESELGVTYNELMLFFDKAFPDMVRTTQPNGRDKYTGHSDDGYSSIWVWGTRENVSSARLMTYVPTMKFNAELHGLNKALLVLFLGGATKLDSEVQAWGYDVVRRCQAGETTHEEKVFGNVRLTIDYKPVPMVFFAHAIAADAVEPNVEKKKEEEEKTDWWSLVWKYSPIWIYVLAVPILYHLMKWMVYGVSFLVDEMRWKRLAGALYVLSPFLFLFFLVHSAVLGWDSVQYLWDMQPTGRGSLYPGGADMYRLDSACALYLATFCVLATINSLITWLSFYEASS